VLFLTLLTSRWRFAVLLVRVRLAPCRGFQPATVWAARWSRVVAHEQRRHQEGAAESRPDRAQEDLANLMLEVWVYLWRARHLPPRSGLFFFV